MPDFPGLCPGKDPIPKIVEAFEHVLNAAKSENLELRDTAIRALGNFVEVISPKDLTEDYKKGMLEAIQVSLGDSSAGVRSKAIRSYGKLAGYGHLTQEEKQKCKNTCELLLGVDNKFEWDRAYIVRKEAQDALDYLEGCED